MVSVASHFPNRVYTGQDGNFYLNGAILYDGNGEDATPKSVDKIISSAEVLALSATPITVLAAVGAGWYPIFDGALVLLDFNSAAYVSDIGEDLVFQQLSSGVVVSQTLDGTEFDGTADALVRAGPNNDDASVTNSLVDNGGFEVTIQTGEWVTGDSPLKIRLFYRTVTLASLIAIA